MDICWTNIRYLQNQIAGKDFYQIKEIQFKWIKYLIREAYKK
jgi:hypothetical protein